MEKVLVSACLMGRRVRFDGNAKTVEDEILDRWRAEERLVVFCPEVAGGLPVPRPPAEIESSSGATAVLTGNARIKTPQGADVTSFFLAGAHAALDAAHRHEARIAILKESSPSCGVHRVYDGSFTGATTSGPGVTARLLIDNGIAVFTESELSKAAAHLHALETPSDHHGV
ncbi:DUF523 domain-containing protein [Nocardiopsis rhodophaea]|uniref:DUF523 domain-containing protein n=1 Tax=Nocardiopsis rhodophaea TaxID=280238 RepID=A0ABN2SNA2_9ACTN